MATHQHAYQYSNPGYREEKHKRSMKTKNSYISYFCVCIKTDAFEDKKLEYYKICSVPQRKTTNHIPTLVKSFVIWFLTNSHRKNTCKCIDRSFGVFKECTNKSKCKELSCVDQLAALQIET